jgi:hypothetical protein
MKIRMTIAKKIRKLADAIDGSETLHFFEWRLRDLQERVEKLETFVRTGRQQGDRS